MKRSRSIILVLAGVYLAIVVCVWLVLTRSAFQVLRELAQSAADSAIDSIDYNVEPEAFRIARAMVNRVGDAERAAEVPLDGLARLFEVEEIDVVDRRGVIRASNRPSNVGYDLARSDAAEALLPLTNGTGCCSLPFRPPIAGDGAGPWCKYVAQAFPAADGFVLIGHSYRDFRHRLDYALDRLMNNYSVGESGYCLLVDRKRGDILSGFAPEMHGKTLAEANLDAKAFDSGADLVPATVFGLPAFVRRVRLDFAEIDAYLILSRRDVLSDRNFACATTAGVLALVFLIGGGLFIKVLNQHALVEEMRAREDAKREEDLKMASNVQKAALPAVLPDLPNARLSATMRVAKEVGGDFYDYALLADGRLLVICADVSDKGIPAAMFMMRSKFTLRAAIESKPTLAEAVTAANALLAIGNDDPVMFVTAWVGILNLATGEMEYVNAGHNPPYLRRTDGSLEPLRENRGIVLAAVDTARFRTARVVLRPGDRLFLFTDGVTEARSPAGELYGERRLEALLAGAALEPEELCRRVIASVDAFAAGGPQADDITILALAYGRA